MPLHENEFIELDYTGRVKDDNSIFDTTEEKIAKENALRGDFKPVTICLGKGHLLHGLEKKLVGKELGAHRIELKAEEAFGKKDAKLMVLVPTQNFIREGIQPQAGLPVNIDGRTGTIRAVTGGRTIVDFNHPLAGKEVIYDVNVRRIVTDPSHKVAALVKVILNVDSQVTVAKDDATVTLKEELPKPIADGMVKEITQLTGLKHVTFLKA
jgi:FKBP-type peptidyl-prolyl cis-trans isomerase 2